jgi:hypothetical protein
VSLGARYSVRRINRQKYSRERANKFGILKQMLESEKQ